MNSLSLRFWTLSGSKRKMRSEDLDTFQSILRKALAVT